MAPSGAEKNRSDFLTGLAALATSLALGFGGYEYMRLAADVERIDGVLSGHSVRLGEFGEYTKAHESDARREIARIDRLEHDVGNLRSDASARPDPWTGTQGRESRAMIRELAADLKPLAPLLQRADWLHERALAMEARLNAIETYWRDTIAPSLVHIQQQLQVQIQQGMAGDRKR